MKKLKIALGLLLLLVSLSSCGIFRDVSKSVDKRQESSKVKEETEVNEAEVITDKTVITTTEEVKTEVKSPQKEVVVKTPIQDLKDGKTITTLDSTGLLRVSILLDSLNNLITTVTKNEETLFVPMTKITQEVRDITTKRDKQEAVRREEEHELKEKSRDVEKTGKPFWFTLMVIGVVAVIVWLVLRFIKRKTL